MAFNALRNLQGVNTSDVNQTTSITQLPANILEAFIPGYSIISKFLWEVLGFDVTLVVSICLLTFGLFTAGKYGWNHASNWFEEYFMSFVSINSDDDIYDHVMEWLAAQDISKKSRSLMAKTGHESAWDLQDGVEVDEEMDSESYINFSNWDAKVPPKFQPYFGTHWFFHCGRLFKFKRTNKTMMTAGWGGNVFTEDESISLTCIGRSTQPIKDLIKETRDHYLDKEKACTVVRRPAPKDQRGRGRSVWHRVATRPSRPMETVVLERSQKDAVLADINEYLHPSTPRWYANRGIPYRRGYLFFGPPGTGKSSLAWAIAGVFGLDIYCISLVEPTLTEEDLGLMFTSLPRRCVVLLEDIDSAGLSKRQDLEKDTKSDTNDAAAKIGAEITKAIQTAQESNKGKGKDNNQGISLSGLLNAIDGVASHEGRVLVMTTNFPEKLDEALIRPGRIDMKVSFTKATRAQICELFTRMYSPDSPAKPFPEAIKTDALQITANGLRERSNANLAKGAVKHESLAPRIPMKVDHLPTPPESPHPNPTSKLPLSELKDIAAEFAARLPDSMFTPAEIQGYLLTRKNEPMRALEEVEAWRDAALEAREKKSKLGPVQ